MFRVAVRMLEGDAPSDEAARTHCTDEQRSEMCRSWGDLGEELCDSKSAAECTVQQDVEYGNPKVEVTKGVVHLFREYDGQNLFSIDKIESAHESERVPVSWVPRANALPKYRSQLLAVLAIPPTMLPGEFCQWCLENSNGMLRQLRIVRDPSKPNIYMALLKFGSQEAADAFFVKTNQLAFNSLEPEVCHLAFVSSITFHNEPPSPLRDGETGALKEKEIPACPVCLEKLDPVESGVVTTICDHDFHCSCLAKWKTDGNCPVCRFSQFPPEMRHAGCMNCESTEDVWICLLCGYLGCGRYAGGHSLSHFAETQHPYALDLESKRVWDYVGDGYVHRLLQNAIDGKVVEHGLGEHGEAALEKDDKSTALVEEYTYLLTSQLESQRVFFESKMLDREKKHRRELQEVKKDLVRAREEQNKLSKCVREAKRGSEAAEQKAAAQLSKLNHQIQTMKDELDFLKSINAELTANQEVWKKELQREKVEKNVAVARKEQEIEELRGQVRDLMLHFESSKAIENSGSDSVVTVADPMPQKKKPRKRKT